MKDKTMTTGDRIRQLREAEGLSQPQLAKILKTSRITINGWETDANKPGLTSLIHLSQFFHVSIDYIAGLEEEETLKLSNLDPESRRAIKQLVRCLEYRSRLTS